MLTWDVGDLCSSPCTAKFSVTLAQWIFNKPLLCLILVQGLGPESSIYQVSVLTSGMEGVHLSFTPCHENVLKVLVLYHGGNRSQCFPHPSSLWEGRDLDSKDPNNALWFKVVLQFLRWEGIPMIVVLYNLNRRFSSSNLYMKCPYIAILEKSCHWLVVWLHCAPRGILWSIGCSSLYRVVKQLSLWEKKGRSLWRWIPFTCSSLSLYITVLGVCSEMRPMVCSR